MHGDRPASSIGHADWEGFLAWMVGQGYDPDYQKKHYVSVNSMFNWGARHVVVPPGTRRFVTVEPLRSLLVGHLPRPWP